MGAGRSIFSSVASSLDCLEPHNLSGPSDAIRNPPEHRATVDENETIISTSDSCFLSLLWACCKKKDLYRGTRIHAELLKRGLAGRKHADALITMYARCNELHKAQTLLNMHHSRTIIPWTAVIEGYARQAQGQNALNCFKRMQKKGIHPDAMAYTSVLKACAVLKAMESGKQIHNEISRHGLLEHDGILGGALVDMYVKCAALAQAHSVLENLSSSNVILWCALIAGYAEKGQGEKALLCYEQMQNKGISPNSVAYSCILKACAAIGALDKGKEIHKEVSGQGLLDRDNVLAGSLVDMYVKCGALLQAQIVLEEINSVSAVLWSALVAGYLHKGLGQEALECFAKMECNGIPPDAVTYVCALKACGMAGALDKGKQMHEKILKRAMLEHNIVLGGALVYMYAKCSALSQAHNVLEKLPSRNVVLWSALIVGYSQKGQGPQALVCFCQMQSDGIMPDAGIYTCALKACAMIGAISEGKQIHDEILKNALLEHHPVLDNALVNMYAKCNELCQMWSRLSTLPSRDVSWNSLIMVTKPLKVLGKCRKKASFQMY